MTISDQPCPKGKQKNPDDFDVPWHPHRGMDILTYLVQGTGRHADSLGNRGEYASPGMQWISVGSGIEHAEGGGTPAGVHIEGFQIWVNTPATHKLTDPRYGTEPPENLPNLSDSSAGMTGRLLSGTIGDRKGPFDTVVSTQMVDYTIASGGDYSHEVTVGLDNCLVYAYKGSGSVNGEEIRLHQIAHLDASKDSHRTVQLRGGEEGLSVIIFSGKKINEPIAWHGPFVMNTKQEIQETLFEYQSGTFLKKRCEWDYKKWSAFPDSMKGEL